MRNSVVLVVALAMANAAPANAQEQPWPGGTWHIWKTDQGCLYYKPDSADAAYMSRYRKSHFSIRWEGSPCTPGKLITGNGAIVEVSNLQFTTGHPGKATNRWACPMVNGLCNGMLVHSDIYPESSATYPGWEQRMGCNASGPGAAGCVPPRPPAEIVQGQP
jgi:hypothetical protein